MEQIKVENEVVYQPEDVILLHKIDFKKIIVSKENFGIFLIKYNAETEREAAKNLLDICTPNN